MQLLAMAEAAQGHRNMCDLAGTVEAVNPEAHKSRLHVADAQKLWPAFAFFSVLQQVFSPVLLRGRDFPCPKITSGQERAGFPVTFQKLSAHFGNSQWHWGRL